MPQRSLALLLVLLSPLARGEWRFSGSAGAYHQQLGVEHSTASQNQRTGVEAQLRLDRRFESQWSFRSDLLVRSDFQARDSVEFFQPVPRQLYVQKRHSTLTFRIGLQTLQLDGPDVVNPADVIHARNWVDPLAPLLLGSAGISLSRELRSWQVELFYVPRQTPPVLPGEHSPWLPRRNRLPLETQDTTIRIPENVRYQYLGATELNGALDHNIAFKLQRKTDSLETQLVYFNGLAQSPFLTTQVTGTLTSINPTVIDVTSPVQLRPLYYRHQALAATFNLPFESWAIRGGLNWLGPIGTDPRVPRETTLLVVGAEKSVETSLGLITGVLDYARQRRQDEDQISFLRSVLEEALILGARVPWGEETSVFVGGIYDLVGNSSLGSLSITHRLNSRWSLEAQARFLQGPRDTLLGLYERHDSTTLKLLRFW
jgi:hypothetical protein